jgi:hypothetical protein
MVGDYIITVPILQDLHAFSEDFLIPRIPFTFDLPSGYTLRREQFPLAPSYATAFNSRQGMTADILGIDLTRPVFIHGQLHAAMSLVRNPAHTKNRLKEWGDSTINVTYNEWLAEC